MLLSENGTPLCQAQHEFKQYYPKPGQVEHDAEEIWEITYQCCLEAISKSKLKPTDIIAIGITNQRETTVLWNRKTGKPIYHAIVWQDRRTSEICDRLKQKPFAEQINAKSGLILDSYLSATKIQWLLNNIPNAKQQAAKGELAFGTIDSFLLWKLTDGKSHFTDATNASRTLLFNIHTQQWDDELLEFFQIPRSLLPEVLDNCADFGVTKKGLFEREIPITAMIGDQQAALVGQACFKPGMMKSTYGTGCFLLLNTGNKVVHSSNRLLSTVSYRINGKPTFGLEGSIFNAGTSIKWLRDNLRLIDKASEAEQLAREVKDTDGVYFVPAFTGLGAPYWDPGARGAIIGLSRNTEINHIVRACLEAVCFRTLDLIQAMQSDHNEKINLIRVDGGMAENNWMLQFLADITACEIQRPQHIESTAIGAGLLALLGAGIYSSLDELQSFWQVDQTYQSNMDSQTRADLLSNWKQAVDRVRTR